MVFFENLYYNQNLTVLIKPLYLKQLKVYNIIVKGKPVLIVFNFFNNTRSVYDD